MSREIKFRAWDEDRQEMIFKFNSEQPFEAPAILQDEETLKFFCGDYMKNGDWQEPILMQYTGLKDKNGKDIYCGDILSEKWKVEVFQNKEGTYMVKFHNNPKHNIERSLYKYLESRKIAECEDEDNIIIGNIYENPNLLK